MLTAMLLTYINLYTHESHDIAISHKICTEYFALFDGLIHAYSFRCPFVVHYYCVSVNLIISAHSVIILLIVGKSNLMDAISFVLGEKTSNLRVKKLSVSCL